MSEDLLALTADIVSAHVGNNTVAPGELPNLISTVHKALAATTAPTVVERPKQDPAVSIRSSVKPDHLVSLESGKKMKMLKRYLMTNYGMTPADYRAKWGLPKDYPMVAPDYAQRRRELAVKIGLGRGGRKAAAQAVPKAAVKKVARKAAPKSAPKAAVKTAAPKATVASAIPASAPLKTVPAKSVVKRGRPQGSKNAKSAKAA